MVVYDDSDYMYVDESNLTVTDKDGLFAFLKEKLVSTLEELNEDTLSEALHHIGFNASDPVDIDKTPFEVVFAAYLAYTDEECCPSGECRIEVLDGSEPEIMVKVTQSDLFASSKYGSWEALAPYLSGWIQWVDTFDNRKFRFVFYDGEMIEEYPVFPSDMGMYDHLKGENNGL